MSQEKDTNVQHEATIHRWKQKKMNAEDRVEHMERSMQRAISKMLKNPETRRGAARDLKEATGNTRKYNFEGGYGVYDDGEVITGYGDLPNWDD